MSCAVLPSNVTKSGSVVLICSEMRGNIGGGGSGHDGDGDDECATGVETVLSTASAPGYVGITAGGEAEYDCSNVAKLPSEISDCSVSSS